MYRGYYYDRDLGMYYLQSRYYDPVTGRFISPDYPDVITASPTALTDKNLFAYCDNNPVMRTDHDGMFWGTLFDVVSLGFSIYDVYNNPEDVLAWLGLAGDLIDLLPIISGLGEATDLLRISKGADNLIDAGKIADGSNDIGKCIVKYGDERYANNTEYYVLQSEIKDLVLALTSVGTSNITSLSNSISVPDVSKAESLTNSEIVRTTISKMVLDSNDVKVAVASCDIKKDRSNNDVVIIKAEELISIIQGISAIGGDFESLNLDITSILTFDEQDFEVISSSSIYRYLLTRELTKSFNSLKYYQLFTTTNDKVDLSGNGDIYTYKAFLMGEYTIQDPTQISAYSKYDDVTVTNIESFSKNDILALSKCTLNVM